MNCRYKVFDRHVIPTQTHTIGSRSLKHKLTLICYFDTRGSSGRWSVNDHRCRDFGGRFSKIGRRFDE